MSFKGAWIWSCSVALAACAPFAGAGSAPPRRDHPELAAGGVVARFGDVAELRIGEHDAGLRAVSIGRGEARTALTSAPVTALGTEVSAERAPGIVEWWRQLASGLEHGVTVAERPAGEGELTLALEVTGLGVRSAGDDAVELTDADGTAVATYAHLVVTDARGRVLPASMRASSGGIDIGVEDAGAVYPVVIDPIVVATEGALIGYLLPAADGDRLGASVAISGDGLYAIAGAAGEDLHGTDAGTALVYVRTAGTWSPTPIELVASDTAAGDALGRSVSISADGSRALVGAPSDDTAGGADSGSAHVFVRAGATWSHEATLLPMGGAASDGFGTAVAISGDGTRAVVGASSDDTAGGANAGSARVFVRSGTTWTEEATLLAPDGAASDAFGWSVAMNADGTRALVGVYFDTVAGTFAAGSVRVFARTGSTWTQETTLVSPESGSEGLGASVSISADGTRAVAGATGANGGLGAGRLFVRTGTTWAHSAELTATDATALDVFGTSVAISPDGARILIGASGDTTPGSPDYGNGSARLFVASGTTWSEGATINGAGTSSGFGSAVALTSDGSRALVGAPTFDNTTYGVTDAGIARVFTLLSTSGSACSAAGTCASGFCADGVCCNTACGGGATDCQACSVGAGGAVDGTCGALSVTAAPTVTCRAAAGVCDPPETCSPSSTTCPVDALSPASTVCRAAAAGSCDVAERCTGTSPTCPADAVAAAGMSCRASTGACDVEDFCDGTSPSCADARRPDGTECRPSLGACDPAEACDGTSTACPADVLTPMGTVCGVGMGDCATPGVCTGTAPACPSSGARPAGTLCRAAISACDVDDFCDGTSQVCTDAFAPADQACGGAPSGVCDAQDHCTGTSGDCMPAYLAGVECRASTGECDPEEVCAGGSADCPPDSLSPSGTVCRASTASCDPVESCDGTAASCPADQNTCSSDGGGTDGGVPSDAGGSADGGPPAPVAGCACGVAARAPAPLLTLLALLAALVARRR